jgi:hypothetical protein
MAKGSLEKRIERLEAIQEIQNLMGRYMFRHDHGAGEGKRIKDAPELYALKTPGVAVEIASTGVAEGGDQVKLMYEEGYGGLTVPQPGCIFEHDLCTPVIEVAEDLQTAKAVWMCPGFATIRLPDGKLKAGWRWHKIALACVKEDGKWKMWKYHVYSTFYTDFYKSWVDYKPELGGTPEMPEGLHLKKTDHDKPYSTDTIRNPSPPAPEPYKTWDLPIEGMPL